MGSRNDAVGSVRPLPAWLMLLVGFAFVGGCGRPAGETRGSGSDRASGTVAKEDATASAALSEDARARVERFCGDCHGMPRPESFPRERWPKEVRQGYDFYLASLRTDLPRPPEGEAIRYFQASAPERIEVPRAADRVEPPSSVDFEPIEILAGADAIDPAIAQQQENPLHLFVVNRLPQADAVHVRDRHEHSCVIADDSEMEESTRRTENGLLFDPFNNPETMVRVDDLVTNLECHASPVAGKYLDR